VKAVDTNVVVRILTNDDPLQARKAIKVFEAEDVFVPITVLLETEWVLRYSYGLKRSVILKALRELLDLPQVATSDNAAVNMALSAYERGIDFADALHVSLSVNADSFFTFDQALIKSAGNLNLGISVRQP
jgi:predicted nucleic-acid-binding protein